MLLEEEQIFLNQNERRWEHKCGTLPNESIRAVGATYEFVICDIADCKKWRV
jgi:hypothetical protein